MHVILTHEQADFDAMGAMLGMYLLNRQAYPIMPRRMNLNVREFINMYGDKLPFVDRRDLPKENIDQVTLVDTQSLYTIKGMLKDMHVRVLDHHELRSSYPEEWAVKIDSVGACTTLVVEQLADLLPKLTTVQASLMLTGIYEDTGALTYAGTTARDVRAVANLLENNASLRLASRFLNPPMSAEQRKVYDRLLTATEAHYIHGQKIIIASAEAEELTDEISSVAHKLRDLLDPDGLFILVQTMDGIRLVARSTTDLINVASVAAHFGGGGHARAAAALISLDQLPKDEEQPLERVRRELVELLNGLIRAPITVGQIMSRQPLLLSPDMSVREAARLMQRYGYEGYPVVKDGKVIGLLNRHAVDRAITHQLEINVDSLMEPGSVSVQPQDSLEHLQSKMTKTGWGQIPVVQPMTEKIIGIVTRTDLLKTISLGSDYIPGKQNLSQQLEAALPPTRIGLLRFIAREAENQHLALYIVGGFVRDLLLNRPSLDFDLVVEGDAISLCKSLAHQLGGRVVSHKRFGTAKWQIEGVKETFYQNLTGQTDAVEANNLPDSLDFITARTEFYDYPTALPRVENGSIKLDLHRRDFTINTMALRLDGRHYGELYDYWGGLSDLQRGLVRVLHSLSFIDDPTRMMRAVRFEQRFGFQIESRTMQLIGDAKRLLRQVSGQRLRHEFDLMLSEENPESMFLRLEELGLLKIIHPGLGFSEANIEPLRMVLNTEVDETWQIPEKVGNWQTQKALAYIVWFMDLDEADIRFLCEILQMPGSLTTALKCAHRLSLDLPNLVGQKASVVVNRLENVPLLSVYSVFVKSKDDQARSLLIEYLNKWQYMKPGTDGNDLREMNVPSGPIIDQILHRLRAAWLDGEIGSSQEEEALCRRLINDLQHHK